MAFTTGGARNSIGEWLVLDWLPFAQSHGYVANQAPAPGTPPINEVFTWKGTVGSPEPPYLYFHAEDENLYVFTGDGTTGTGPAIDTAQEAFDQPGNPSNSPQGGGYGTAGENTSPERDRCVRINKPGGGGITASYMFSPAGNEYIHAVIQLADRSFRHLNIGDISVDDATTLPEAWFIFGQYWNQDSSDIDSPYSVEHKWFPSVTSDGISAGTTSSSAIRHGYVRMPGMPGDDDWFFLTDQNNNDGRSTTISKPVGDVNNLSGDISAGQVTLIGGGGSFMGRSLFNAETPLMATNVPFIPLRMLVNKPIVPGSRGMWGPVGTLPGMFRCSMRTFSPNQQVSIAGSNYRVYPAANSDTVSTNVNEEYSGWEGIAYAE